MTDKRATNGPAVQSMTGYAMLADNLEPQITVELRGVNSRFLDPVLRMPDELRSNEPAIRDLMRKTLTRGKIECRVNLRLTDSAATLTPNPAVLQGLKSALAALQKNIPALTSPSAADLLNFPGLFSQPVDHSQLQHRLLSLAEQALHDFVQSRQTEGARLTSLILARLDDIEQIVSNLRGRAPEMIEAYENKLTTRINLALATLPDIKSIDPAELTARVSQEVSIYGLRADVAEETDRLLAHVSECRDRLAGRGPVGKRLDFLMQELNREANTLGAKASAIDLSRAAIDLKVVIEQIREQVQNLE